MAEKRRRVGAHGRGAVFTPQQMNQVLDKISEADHDRIFHFPVDTSLYQNYLAVVKTPMSLQDVRGKIASASTSNGSVRYTPADLRADLSLVFDNCLAYNLAGSPIIDYAHRVRAVATAELDAVALS